MNSPMSNVEADFISTVSPTKSDEREDLNSQKPLVNLEQLDTNMFEESRLNTFESNRYSAKPIVNPKGFHESNNFGFAADTISTHRN